MTIERKITVTLEAEEGSSQQFKNFLAGMRGTKIVVSELTLDSILEEVAPEQLAMPYKIQRCAGQIVTVKGLFIKKFSKRKPRARRKKRRA